MVDGRDAGVYVVDVDEWAAVNAELAHRYDEHRPARIVVPTGTSLRYGSIIEVDATVDLRSDAAH
jgi:hypothetical protein